VAERTGGGSSMIFGAGADDLRLPVKEALAAIARLGLRDVEADARGDISPAQLTRTGRRHLSRYLADLGLRLVALGGTAPGASLDQQVDHAGRTLEMARELGVEVVSVSLADLGVRPADPAAGVGEDIMAALRQMADRADLTARTLAVETAGVVPQVLRRLIQEVSCDRVRACIDPAELIGSGQNLKTLYQLADFVGLARVRDALAGRPSAPGREVPLGEGQVDLREYFMSLRDFGYRRPTLIRRRHSERPLPELLAAKKRLEELARQIEGR